MGDRYTRKQRRTANAAIRRIIDRILLDAEMQHRVWESMGDQEEQEQVDRPARAMATARSEGFSVGVARDWRDIPAAYHAQCSPRDHGLVPPFSDRKSGKKRRAVPPKRWAKERSFDYPPPGWRGS